MIIRSITTFTDLALTEPELALAQAANFLHNAGPAFEQAGFTVQTRRVATQPFPRILAPIGPGLAVAYATRVQELVQNYGIDFLSLGPVHADDDPDYVDAIPDMLEAAEGIFCSVSIADPQRGIDLALIRQTAEVIRKVSTVTADGLSNLYLAAIANCGPGAPFFPVAYHDEGRPTHFALAIQAADLAIDAFNAADSITDAQHRLTAAVENAAAGLAARAEALADEFDIRFSGIDFSLAPFPEDTISLGGAMERLGIELGGAGSASAAAVIMTALDQAQFPRTGFNGLMLPVLEDSVLARRASEGLLTITDLLLYSAICGTGLDTLPLPGDTSTESLAGVLLDVAGLALRLGKPLTARLMPLPGKAAGDSTDLEDFPYFAPGHVMPAPRDLAAGGLLDRDGRFGIQRRTPR
jgi:uncharacterized protein (UPF0210 family)